MKPTKEEVLRLMRQASGGILTQVAEDPRCGYEIKVEELQTFAELLQAKTDSVHLAVQLDSPESRLMGDPSEDESLIACLCDDAAKLNQANPGDEMAATMLVAAARIEELQELLSGISSPSHRPNEKNAVQEKANAFLAAMKPFANLYDNGIYLWTAWALIEAFHAGAVVGQEGKQ